MTRQITISVEIKRDYGGTSVNFGMTETVAVESGHQRRDAYMNLLAQLDDQIKLFETHELHNFAPPSKPGNTIGNSQNLEKIPAQTLCVEFKNNRKYMSLKGGKYTKFGVAIYPDSCTTELELDSFDLGEHDIMSYGMVATIDIKNGKAQRVLSIS